MSRLVVVSRLDVVSRLVVVGRLVGVARRAGEDEISRLDCDEAREVGDDVIRLEDELARARLIATARQSGK